MDFVYLLLVIQVWPIATGLLLGQKSVKKNIVQSDFPKRRFLFQPPFHVSLQAGMCFVIDHSGRITKRPTIKDVTTNAEVSWFVGIAILCGLFVSPC